VEGIIRNKVRGFAGYLEKAFGPEFLDFTDVLEGLAAPHNWIP